MPPFDHRSHPLLLRMRRWRGKVNAVLTTMAKSLRPSCQTLAVSKLHTFTRSGYPVSLMFRSAVVTTMMNRQIQKRVKKPRKLW